MKNPFERDDHTVTLITAIGVGAVVGAGLAYLYLTDKGAEYRKQLATKFKEEVSDKAADLISNNTIIPKKAAKVATDTVVK